MYFSNYLTPYCLSIAILLWVSPVIWLLLKRKTFDQFTIRKLTQAVNRSVLYFGIFAAVLMIVMSLIDIFIYGQQSPPKNTDIYEAIIASSYLYVVYGCFLYVPILLVLNLTTLMTKQPNAHSK